MKCRAWFAQPHRLQAAAIQLVNPASVIEQWREQAIVRRQKNVLIVFDDENIPVGADARVDDGDMHGA